MGVWGFRTKWKMEMDAGGLQGCKGPEASVVIACFRLHVPHSSNIRLLSPEKLLYCTWLITLNLMVAVRELEGLGRLGLGILV